ncbi:MAG TPA: hypothetical protein VHG08_13485 [Longimicrobium sp.]|nr:hypothetical protein [Longimicrobium sp.]
MQIINKSLSAVNYRISGRASGPVLMEGTIKPGETVSKDLSKEQEPYRFYSGAPCIEGWAYFAEYRPLANDHKVVITSATVMCSLSLQDHD